MDVMKVVNDRKFNDDCVQVVTHITFVFLASSRLDGVLKLANTAMLDGDLCVVKAQLFTEHAHYGSTNNLLNLAQQILCEMHHKAYKHFQQLVVYLLTMPVTSASCECSHSKANLIKSTVRSSLTAGRLENLVAMVCEKKNSRQQNQLGHSCLICK
jgi:hypothetical protein